MRACVSRQGPYIKILAVVSDWAVFILRLHKMGHICCRLLIEAIHRLTVCTHYVPDILPDSEDSRQNHALLSESDRALEQDKMAQAEVVMLSFRKVAGEGTSSASLWKKGILARKWLGKGPELRASLTQPRISGISAIRSRTGGRESSGHKGHYGRLLWGLGVLGGSEDGWWHIE